MFFYHWVKKKLSIKVPIFYEPLLLVNPNILFAAFLYQADSPDT